MPAFLVSPAEPDIIKALGVSSSVPEQHGADILWASARNSGLVGVQRKTVTDLIASLGDRLSRELVQLQSCAMPFLIIEGGAWTADGQLVDAHHRWTRSQLRSVIRSVQQMGVVVEETTHIGQTIERVEEIAKWAEKEHYSLKRRAKNASSDGWGTRSNRDTQCWILQSVDGVSRKTAEQIIDHFGHLPLALTVTRSDLTAIRGIGPKTADAIVLAFGEAA